MMVCYHNRKAIVELEREGTLWRALTWRVDVPRDQRLTADLYGIAESEDGSAALDAEIAHAREIRDRANVERARIRATSPDKHVARLLGAVFDA